MVEEIFSNFFLVLEKFLQLGGTENNGVLQMFVEPKKQGFEKRNGKHCYSLIVLANIYTSVFSNNTSLLDTTTVFFRKKTEQV